MRKYYDVHIRVDKESKNVEENLESMLTFGDKLGIDAVVLMVNFDKKSEVKNFRGVVEEFRKKSAYTGEIYIGLEVGVEKVSELRKRVKKLRSLVDLVAVLGGDVSINRAACENVDVDLLVHPEFGRKDNGLDHVMCKLASKNGVAIELSFSTFLNKTGKQRAHLLTHMRRNVMLAEKYGVCVVVGSFASTMFDMRKPRDLASLAYACGLSLEKSLDSVSKNVEKMIKENLEKRDPNYVMPGVKIVKRGRDYGKA